MNLGELIKAVRYRWKGIATTDPENESLKRLVQHGLVSIRSHCPMAFMDGQGMLGRVPSETDWMNDWRDDDDVPLPDEFLGALVTFCLWKLYSRDQNDVRDQSITAMMRRDYLAALGIEGAANGQ